MKKNRIDNETLWLTMFTVIPVIVYSRLPDAYFPSNTQNLIYSAIIGAISGLIGFGVYSISKNKTIRTKILILLMFITIVFTSFIISLSQINKLVKSCDVCGYEAYDKKSEECKFCFNERWLNIKNSENITKEEWLREEQLFLFEYDSIENGFGLYTPEIIDGFRKDNKWKPIITIEELKTYNE